MKPHVVVHMTASIDGRTLPSRWSPKRESSTSHYERIHEKLEGGGVTNGALLRAGLVDEISVLVSPVVDGAPGAPALFDAVREDDGKTTKVKDIALTSSETLDGGVVWLRYAVTT